ncbi:nucleotidyltransferase family protein [Legionella fallonii]|uniref:Poly(A) polymerase n=1 Tax=Legionella fallonii LLAP-10 TaxID=1212491 RepID=A0A098GAA2_9GAMM|nr:hypothetical protein [Legionella fallonii]CEG58415.1 protein of unknown function [Legionella fallonii LLAP-10]
MLYLFNKIKDYISSLISDLWMYCFGYSIKEDDEPQPEAVTADQTEVVAPLSPPVEVGSASLDLDKQSQMATKSDGDKKTKFRLDPKALEFFPSHYKANLPKSLTIKRSQFPPQMIQLIDELRVQFPDAKFYLTGGCPANILDALKPNDYDILVINADLDLIQKYLETKKINSERRSNKFPILFCDLGQGVTLDFSVKKCEQSKDIGKTLEADYLTRDFNLNALYVEFTVESEFSVFSFFNALKAQQGKVITSVSDPLDAFAKDPIRLFRLAKLLITNPTYSLEWKLRQALKQIGEVKEGQPQWLWLFQAFIKAEFGNWNRLDYAMRKLFERYNYQEINKAFETMGLLTAFTDNTYDDVERACSKIPLVGSSNKFIYWILANVLQRFENGKEHQLFSWHSILNLSYYEEELLDFIYAQGAKQSFGIHVVAPEIQALIGGFQLSPENEEKQQLVMS